VPQDQIESGPIDEMFAKVLCLKSLHKWPVVCCGGRQVRRRTVGSSGFYFSRRFYNANDVNGSVVWKAIKLPKSQELDTLASQC
jgi:hypothetical protein